jgi:hypothetical protein
LNPSLVAIGPILLQKSVSTTDQNFSGLPMRFLDTYMRDPFSGGKLTGDFTKELEDRFIGDGANLNFLTKKLVPNNFGLLQQYRP